MKILSFFLGIFFLLAGFRNIYIVFSKSELSLENKVSYILVEELKDTEIRLANIEKKLGKRIFKNQNNLSTGSEYIKYLYDNTDFSEADLTINNEVDFASQLLSNDDLLRDIRNKFEPDSDIIDFRNKVTDCLYIDSNKDHIFIDPDIYDIPRSFVGKEELIFETYSHLAHDGREDKMYIDGKRKWIEQAQKDNIKAVLNNPKVEHEYAVIVPQENSKAFYKILKDGGKSSNSSTNLDELISWDSFNGGNLEKLIADLLVIFIVFYISFRSFKYSFSGLNKNA